jgi:hypothetical protein
MNEIDHFKVFILDSGDAVADVNHLHVRRIHLVYFSYIVIEDLCDLLKGFFLTCNYATSSTNQHMPQ